MSFTSSSLGRNTTRLTSETPTSASSQQEDESQQARAMRTRVTNERGSDSTTPDTTYTHCRDLGGQLNMTKRLMTPTLTKRISKVRRSIRKIGGIPTATKRKARSLRVKSVTIAIDISPANKTELCSTQSAVINAVCPQWAPEFESKQWMCFLYRLWRQ